MLQYSIWIASNTLQNFAHIERDQLRDLSETCEQHRYSQEKSQDVLFEFNRLNAS